MSASRPDCPSKVERALLFVWLAGWLVEWLSVNKFSSFTGNMKLEKGNDSVWQVNPCCVFV